MPELFVNPMRHVDDEAACRVCGCTENDPCPEGCWWVPDPEELGDLCSSCAEGPVDFDA